MIKCKWTKFINEKVKLDIILSFIKPRYILLKVHLKPKEMQVSSKDEKDVSGKYQEINKVDVC